MTTQEALDFFGGRKQLAMSLGLWTTATYNWGEYPPKAAQYQLQVITNGQLKVEQELLNGYTTTKNPSQPTV